MSPFARRVLRPSNATRLGNESIFGGADLEFKNRGRRTLDKSDRYASTMTDGFELFCQGRLAEAIAAYSAEIECEPSPLLFANRALARLRAGDCRGAMTDYEAAENLELPSARGDAYRKRMGAALWVMGQCEQALAAWENVQEGLRLKQFAFTDAAGGVQAGLLSWFAAGCLGEDRAAEQALAFLRMRVKAATRQLWPLPLAQFVLHEIAPRELVEIATAAGTLADRRLCQAHFYVAMRTRFDGQGEQDVATSLRAAVAHGRETSLEIEYDLAVNQLRTSGPGP
jgi:tetratricopeptide (TPR) repeat protein